MSEPGVCEILGCPTGSAMARHIDHLTDRLSMERARADRLDAECAALQKELMQAEQRMVRMEMRHGAMADCMSLIVRAIDANHFGTAMMIAVGSLKEDANEQEL